MDLMNVKKLIWTLAIGGRRPAMTLASSAMLTGVERHGPTFALGIKRIVDPPREREGSV